MSRVSGRWKLGILLALTTAILWGVLPIALKVVMETLDPITTTFFRYALAGLLLTPYIAFRSPGNKGLNPGRFRSVKLWLQLLAAGLLLTGNYGLYILGLERTTAEATQLMIQLAPMFLLLSGLWLFGERFSKVQWLGFAGFFSGLLMFFYPHLYDANVAINSYSIGMLLVFLAAVLWTGYAILQKYLLREFSSQETMLVFYWIGALAFLPFCDFAPMSLLSGLQWSLLIFCGLNTLIAYGSFAEAMVHIEASKVSTVLALTPLITVAMVQAFPISGISVEPLTALSISGAILVVVGSMVTALNKRTG